MKITYESVLGLAMALSAAVTPGCYLENPDKITDAGSTDSGGTDTNPNTGSGSGGASDSHGGGDGDTDTDVDTDTDADGDTLVDEDSPSGTGSAPGSDTGEDTGSETGPATDTGVANNSDTGTIPSTESQRDTDTATEDDSETAPTSCTDNSECPLCHICDFTLTCVPASEGSDPKSECETEAPETCGLNGTCDGQGACQHYGEQTTCDDGDPMTLDDRCSGAGACAGVDYCLENDCWKVPPTGQTQCYNLEYDDTVSCTPFPCNEDGSPQFCGQDAQYPDNERTFTCYSADGTQQLSCDWSADPDETVVDSLTGLTWQRTWIANVSWEEARSYCENLTYAGRDNWRLPDSHELASIIDYGKTLFLVDDSAFPGLQQGDTWFLTDDAIDENSVFMVEFYEGRVLEAGLNTPHYEARCVSGDRLDRLNQNRFVAMGEVVLDRATGLTWQKGHATNGNWPEALAYCEEMSLGGYDNWRLPSISELRSLFNVQSESQVSAFDDLTTGEFLTSTTHFLGSFTNGALTVDFAIGLVDSANKDALEDVRCVRGGP